MSVRYIRQPLCALLSAQYSELKSDSTLILVSGIIVSINQPYHLNGSHFISIVIGIYLFAEFLCLLQTINCLFAI